MTSITDILAMEPRYSDKTITNHEQIDHEARSIMSWTTVASEQAILDDRHLNAAKAILGKKLAEAVQEYFDHYMQDEADDVDDCVCRQEQHERAKAVKVALEEWNKLEGVK